MLLSAVSRLACGGAVPAARGAARATARALASKAGDASGSDATAAPSEAPSGSRANQKGLSPNAIEAATLAQRVADFARTRLETLTPEQQFQFAEGLRNSLNKGFPTLPEGEIPDFVPHLPYAFNVSELNPNIPISQTELYGNILYQPREGIRVRINVPFGPTSELENVKVYAGPSSTDTLLPVPGTETPDKNGEIIFNVPAGHRLYVKVEKSAIHNIRITFKERT